MLSGLETAFIRKEQANLVLLRQVLLQLEQRKVGSRSSSSSNGSASGKINAASHAICRIGATPQQAVFVLFVGADAAVRASATYELVVALQNVEHWGMPGAAR